MAIHSWSLVTNDISTTMGGLDPLLPKVVYLLLPKVVYLLLPSSQLPWSGFPTHLVYNKWVKQPGLHLTHSDWVAAQVAARKILRSARQPVNVSQLAVMACGDLYEEQDLSSIVHCPQGTEPSAEYSRASGTLHKKVVQGSESVHYCSHLGATELIVASGKRWTEPVVFYSLIIQFTSQGMNDSWNNTKRIK